MDRTFRPWNGPRRARRVDQGLQPAPTPPESEDGHPRRALLRRPLEGSATPPLDLHTFNEDRSGDDLGERIVSINGVISIANQMFSVGKMRSGHLVDVRVLPTLLQVWDGAELIKSIPRTNTKEVRKKRAEPHRKRQNQ